MVERMKSNTQMGRKKRHREEEKKNTYTKTQNKITNNQFNSTLNPIK